jgi:hypothetical protein
VSPARTQAYRRVIDTLDQLGPSKLCSDEQERIRYAADALIFSCDLRQDSEARDALKDAGRLCTALVESGRWESITAARLASDLSECGPEPRLDSGSDPDAEPEPELSPA